MYRPSGGALGNWQMRKTFIVDEQTHRAEGAHRGVGRHSSLAEHRAAISEVLRVIASSPGNLQPIFDTVLESATRLCRADIGTLRLRQEEGFRLVALRGYPDVALETFPLPAVIANTGFYAAQLLAKRAPVHIPDLETDEALLRSNSRPEDAFKPIGLRTYLIVPMLKDEEVIGTLAIGRLRVQPFANKVIELITDFAAEAAIALEITRRERQYRELQMELAHANRITTMGQLTASIVHEVKQPITAAVTYALAARRWLSADPPNFREVDDALSLIVKEGNRADEVVGRIRDLIKKAPPRKDRVEINGAIREVIELTYSEAVKNGVSVQTQFAESLPLIQGDRVQLQQVMLNLIINAIQAMSGLAAGVRELRITTENTESEGVRLAVRDSGPGLSSENFQRLFEPFYTTKPNGMGMGLSICRSIIEAHGGRLWATGQPRGALFQFTIPTNSAADHD
jgi:signal transduction histidine kinase